MAQSVPTARIPPPPGICRAFVFFKKKMLQKSHGGASTFIQIPHGGASGKGQIPDPWDKFKILFNDLSKKENVLVVFSGFSTVAHRCHP